ncbi:GNAT family N-acetyltransferase [Streptomyces sp. NPDC091281]|uniref:GNAT family N-acetyltransferase n=1 Tax=Streptomyces sp. NPDC091281 TaxID=3365985 RepID=UPI0037F552F8
MSTPNELRARGAGTLRLIRTETGWPHIEWEVRTPTEAAAYLKALDGDSVWISHIGVAPEYRGQGLANNLLSAVLAEYSTRVIGLAAAPFPSWRQQGLDHDDLQRWYRRHGFTSAPLPGDPYRMIRPATPYAEK